VRAVFGERLWSSLVFAPLVAGAFYLGRLYFAALILLVSVFGATEYRRIMSLAGVEIHIAFIPISAAVALAGYLVPSMFVTVLSGGAVLVLSIALIKSGTAPSAMFSLSGVMYVGGLLGSLFLLRAGPQGRTWSFFVLMATWVTDVGAYMGGVALGKHKLAPKISPGKSWEGFVGGVAAAVLVAFLVLYRDRDEFLTIPEDLALGVAMALASVLGDLFESAVKRDLRMKDSGRLLGGHGGMLDRLDSLLWAGPAAYFVIFVFAQA
jgi:phosphatidate cytidylyltransferase